MGKKGLVSLNPLECVSVKGSGITNEDIAGYDNGRFWVLDGATPTAGKRFLPGESDAAFLVRAFDSALKDVNAPGLSNMELCRAAMRRVREELGNAAIAALDEPIHKPSFAMAMVHIAGDTIDISNLSDCAVFVKRRGSNAVLEYTDNRIAKAGRRTRRIIDHVRNLGGTLSEEAGKELVMRQIRKNRKLMNAPNGYFVGTLDGAAFTDEHAYNHRINTGDACEILLASDGFTRLFDYRIMSAEELFSSGITLAEAARVLREYENARGEWAEFKRNDDCTAMLIKYGKGFYD